MLDLVMILMELNLVNQHKTEKMDYFLTLYALYLISNASLEKDKTTMLEEQHLPSKRWGLPVICPTSAHLRGVHWVLSFSSDTPHWIWLWVLKFP